MLVSKPTDTDIVLENLYMILNVSKEKLYDILLKREYVYRSDTGVILSYDKYNRGDTHYFDNVHLVYKGYPSLKVYVTQKGIKHLKEIINNGKYEDKNGFS